MSAEAAFSFTNEYFRLWTKERKVLRAERKRNSFHYWFYFFQKYNIKFQLAAQDDSNPPKTITLGENGENSILSLLIY